MGRQQQGMDRPGVRKSKRAVENREKMEKTGCKIICGAPTTPMVKGLMMMMIMRPLNIFSGISAIPQPISITEQLWHFLQRITSIVLKLVSSYYDVKHYHSD